MSSYKDAGVDIQAGDETVKRIKGYAKSTFNRNVLTDIGMFGGLYELDLKKFRQPVLVSSVDGVGTKLKVAAGMKIYDTIGQDLVNHCVNDIAVCGAEPLFFLDYYAVGKLNPETAEQVIKGFAVACKENNCALIGGETAEMPGVYSNEDFDIAGTIVGIVEKEKIIDDRNIERGDLLIGFPSSGLHTNGFSLARKVIQSKFDLHQKIGNLKSEIGVELLAVHKSYLNLIKNLKENFSVKGLSHITGGGLVGNTMRIIKEPLQLAINWDAWTVPEIFKVIQIAGNISDEEMRKVFNVGIGLVAIFSKNEIDSVQKFLTERNETHFLIGEVV